MIKANELRREILVLKDNRILPVYSIHGDNTFTLKKDGEIIGCFTEWQADPIPLTPELLEKAGFEKTEVGKQYTTFENKTSEISIVKDANGFYACWEDGRESAKN